MATNVQLISPAEVAQLVPKVVAQANQIVISTDDDYEMTASFLQLIATRKKEVEATFDPIIAKAHEAHKEACGQKKKFMDPLIDAEKTTKRKMIDFDDERERLRKIEEARLAEIARQEQEAAVAEAARLAKIEADRIQEAALTEAAQLEAQGEKVLADIVLQHAADCVAMAPAVVAPIAAPVVVQSTVPKVEGIAKTVNWEFEVTDERLIPREFLSVNMQAIRAVVRAQKGLAKIPGVRTWPASGVRTTGR